MAERMLTPVGRPASAIASGYLALFGIVPLFGLPFAIGAMISGLIALKAIQKNPELSGTGRAWFGIILGGLMITITLFAIVIVAVNQSPSR